jgi:glycine/D-amino acid oxidase-like deaminating enzyme
MSNKYAPYSNKSGWNALLPPRTPKPPAEGRIAAKYAIIGGGYTGVAVARRLAELEPSAHIVVLDATEAGEGAAGRNSGFTGGAAIPQRLPDQTTTDPRQGRERAETVALYNTQGLEWLKEIMTHHGFGCDMTHSGSYRGSSTRQGIEMVLAQQRAAAARGIELPYLDASELARQTGTTFYKGAILLENNHFIQPAMLIRGLVDSLPENVSMYENTLVTSLSRGSNWVLKTDRAEITADVVVLANAASVKSFGYLRDKLITLYTYAGLTEEMSPTDAAQLGENPAWGLTLPQRAGGSTVRRVGERRFMVRSLYSYNSELNPAAVKRRLTEKFHRRFPSLSHVGFEYVWGGMTDLSANAKPVWGRLDEGLYVSVGYNGLGITKGTIMGKLLAEKITGVGDVSHFEQTLGVANWLPPEPFRRIGFGMLTSYKTWLAGTDAT